MTGKKIETTLVIRGDSKNAVRQLKLTGEEVDKLIGKQKRAIPVTDKLKSGYTNLSGALSKYAAIGGGIAVAATGALITRQLALIDTTAKTADILGITTEKLGGYRHASEIAGVSNESFDKSIKKMNRSIGEAIDGVGTAKDQFDKFGISNKQFFELKPDEQFEIIADKIKGLGTQTEKAAAASDIFGRSGVDMLNLFELGSQGIGEYVQQVDEAGAALSRIDAAKVEMANDSMTKAKLSAQGFAQQLTVKVAPVIDDLATRIFSVSKETDGVGTAADKSFGFVIKAVGVMANGFHGLKIIIKGIEVALAGIASAAVVTYGKIIEGYTRLASIIPGIDIKYEDTAFAKLEESVVYNFKQTAKELEELVMQALPSDAIEDYIAGVERASTEAAAVIAENAANTVLDVGEIGEESEETSRKIKKVGRSLTDIQPHFRSTRSLAVGTFGDIREEFTSTIKDMILFAAANPIMLSMGLGGGSSFGGGFGSSIAGSIGAGLAGKVAGGLSGAGGLLKSAVGLGGNSMMSSGMAAKSLLSAIPGWGWALGGLGALYGVLGDGDGWERSSLGFSTGATPAVKGKHTFGTDNFASGLGITRINRRGTQQASNSITDIFKSRDSQLVDLISRAGGSLNLSGVSLQGTHADFGVNSGNFFGLRGGENGLEDASAIGPLLSSFTSQLLSHAKGLDADLQNALKDASGDWEKILMAFESALQSGADSIEDITEQEQLLNDVRQDSVLSESQQQGLNNAINKYAPLLSSASSLRETIQQDIYSALGATNMRPASGGSATGSLSDIARMRQTYLDQFNQQVDYEKQLHDQKVRQYEAQIDLANDIANALVAADSGSLSPLSGSQRLSGAKSRFGSLVKRALSGDVEAGREAIGARRELLDIAQGQSSSAFEYSRLFGSTRGDLSRIQGLMSGAAAPGEFSVNASTTNQLARNMERLLEHVTSAEVDAQQDLLNAVLDLGFKMESLPSALAGLLPAFNSGISGGAIRSVVQQVKGSGLSRAGKISELYRIATNNGVGSAQLASAIGASQEDVLNAAYSVGLPSFDVGTGRVPQTGPAIIHKDEGIIRAGDMEFLRKYGIPVQNNNPATGEMRSLVNQMLELQQYNYEITKSNKRMYEIFRRWNDEGMPPERAA